MFQSIEYKRYLGPDSITKLNSYEYELIDSDFSCVVAVSAGASSAPSTPPFPDAATESTAGGAVIQEYSKRNLNVASNLVRFFKWYENGYGYSIAEQITWAEQYQHQFTPELKADLDKYLVLL
jgi:hypothetical protein